MSNSDSNKRLVPSRSVCDRYGLKAIRSLRRWILAGTFPPPDKIINKRNYWWLETLERHERRSVTDPHASENSAVGVR